MYKSGNNVLYCTVKLKDEEEDEASEFPSFPLSYWLLQMFPSAGLQGGMQVFKSVVVVISDCNKLCYRWYVS